MDSVEVQEFLMTTTAANNVSLLLETDNLFENTNLTANNSTSMYFSINDDTLSNRIVDEMKLMERTLTAPTDEGETSTRIEATVNEENFQRNLHLPFPNLRSQCSTPKLETAPRKPVDAPKIVTELLEKGLDVMPLSTVLNKIGEKKTVTIVDAEDDDKENLKRLNQRKSLKPRDGIDSKPVVPAKKPTLRKSMIPNAPSTVGKSTAAVKDVAVAPKNPKPSLMTRKSVRLSVVPPQMKATSRYTISGRTAKINSPTLARSSPRTKKSGTIPKSSLTAAAHRMTINSNVPKSIPTIPESESNPAPETDSTEDKAKKRMSRIPPPSKIVEPTMAKPRLDFTCATCKKSFHLKSTLLTHQKIHTTTSSAFKCHFCDKDFEKEVGLRNHVERYCEKVPVAEKRKLNANHNRTTSAEIRERSRKEKSSTTSSRLENTTSSSVGSQNSVVEQSTIGVPKKEHETSVSPRKAIKSISHPHSGIKFSANKPIKCYPCQITFNKYVDFHNHVDKHHPQPSSAATSPGTEKGAEAETKGSIG